jgi:hypothetical protein
MLSTRVTLPSSLRFVGALAIGLGAGCTGGLNSSNELLGAPPLTALSGPPAPEAAPTGIAAASGEPSLGGPNGLDRRGWPVVVVSVPRGQVEVQPAYVTTLLPDQSLPRDRGEFPIGGDVLDETGSAGAEVLQAASNAAGSPLFLLSAPVEMLMGRWWWVTERDHPTSARVPTPTRTIDPWVWITPPAAADPLPSDAPQEPPIGTPK